MIQLLSKMVFFFFFKDLRWLFLATQMRILEGVFIFFKNFIIINLNGYTFIKVCIYTNTHLGFKLKAKLSFFRKTKIII